MVGGLQNRLRAAVVLLERDDRGVWIVLGKVEDVAHRGRAKGVDRLGVVAHDGQALALGREQIEDIGLERVGVLIFIDQHAIEQLADGVARMLIGQQGVPVEQQVVVIENAAGFLAIDVAVEKLLQFVRPLLAPGKCVRQNLVEFLPGVDAAAVDGHAGALFREPLVGLGQVQLGADDVHQVFRVGAVVDGEFRRQADRLAVSAQQSRGDGVKGAAPNAGNANFIGGISRGCFVGIQRQDLRHLDRWI